MTAITHILVPTDFSPEAANALSFAAGIAGPLQAGIVLMHVVDGNILNIEALDIDGHQGVLEDDGSFGLHSYQERVHLYATQRIKELAGLYAQLPVRTELLYGRIHRHIEEFVARHPDTLIVMGSKGTTEATGFLMGSNTEKVIRNVKCPVVAVKCPIPQFRLGHICFASDFSSVPAAALRLLQRLQQLFNARLHLVKIITPNNFELSSMTYKSMEDFARQHQLSNYSINTYNHYTEYEGILAFAAHIGADLIALTTHGNKGLMHMFMGSIAEDVANHANLPVLTFNQYA